MIFTPRPYQELIHNFVFDHERCNVFASMGMGKTGASILVFDTLRMFGEAKRALVIAPRRVALHSWPGEVAQWHKSFGHLHIAAAIGTPAQRIAALKSNADIVTINYDNLPWLIEVMGEHWNFDTVIADESPRLKGLRISLQRRQKKDGTWGDEFITGQGSGRAKAIASVAFRKVRRWINLTGSPAPNGLQDLWGQCWFVDGGKALGSSFTAFSDRWFRTVPGSDPHQSRIEPMPFSQAQIEAAIKPFCITVDAKDWFDLEDVVERVIKVPLPPKARRIYDQMEDELFAELDAGVEIEAFNAGSKCQKCLQIGNGAVFTDRDGNWTEVHDEKLQALESIVNETNGEPILLRYTHVPDRKRILKQFPRAKFLDDKQATIDTWNKGKIPMLVTHAASAGHGLSLQHGGRILVDFTTDYNLEHDEQIIERVGPTRQAQSGYKRSVYRYRLIAEDTIEQNAALPRLKTKASVQDSLKDAMKLRKGC